METIIDVLFPGVTVFGRDVFYLGSIEISAPLMIVGFFIVFVAVYSLISGLIGVAITDMFQFAIAMTGTIILAVYAVNSPEIGGIAGLKAALPAETFRFVPTIGQAAEGIGVLGLSVASFTAYIGVQWWFELVSRRRTCGGGYVAQRMMSAKDGKKRHVCRLFGLPSRTIAFRPWPWIMVALRIHWCSISRIWPTPAKASSIVMKRCAFRRTPSAGLFAAFIRHFTSYLRAHLELRVHPT